MKLENLFKSPWAKKGITAVLLLALLLISFFPIAKVATSPETFTSTIQSIDEKKGNRYRTDRSSRCHFNLLSRCPN